MARFSQNAADRTVKAVRHVELQLQRGDRIPRGRWPEPAAEAQWYELQEWLPPGKSAPARRLILDASANAGKGDYEYADDKTYLIYDFSDGQPAAKNEWVRGRIAGVPARLAWEPLQGHEEIWRYQLEGALSPCGSAQVHFLDCNLQTITYLDEDNVRHTYRDYLYDPLGIAQSSPFVDANCVLPAGYRGYAKWMPECLRWEMLDVGECDCSSSTSSSSSGSPSSDAPSSGQSDAPSSAASDSPCVYTGQVTVGNGVLTRDGDYICQGTKILTFAGGRLCGIADGPESCVYVCCPDEDPSSSSSSAPPPSSSSSSDGIDPDAPATLLAGSSS